MAIRTAPLPVPREQERTVAAPAVRRAMLPAILLGLILLAGGVLRFNGLNWDDGTLLHPDERHVTDVIANRIYAPQLSLLLDPRHSTLNTRSVNPNPGRGEDPNRPRQFAYGSLPLYITDLVAWLWGGLTGENWNAFWKIFRVGRFLTVLFDLATVALTYALARRAYGTVAGLLAAAFVALAPLPIQLAHFFVTDTWLTTLVTAATLAALVGAQRGTVRAFVLAGFLLGCAMATKGSVVLFGFTIAVAAWLATWEGGRKPREMVGRFAAYALAAGGAAALAFLLFEPYAILDSRTYLRDIGEQSAIVSGKYDVPFTRQYVGTMPLIYQAGNLLGWGLGAPLGALALSGFAFVLWRAGRQRRTADLVLLSWVVPYLALLAFNEIKFLRYLLPVLPLLLIFGASLLTELGAFGPAKTGAWARLPALRGGRAGKPDDGHGHDHSPNGATPRPAPRTPRRSWDRWGASALALAVLAGTGLTAIAFSAIYSRPHTRVAASEWIYANVPPGSKLSRESWDDSLPLILGPGRTAGEYKYELVTFDLYGDLPACDRSSGRTPPPQLCTPNTEATFEYLAGQLEKVDYIVESSARLHGSIPRLPWRYPVQQHYFELLFDGRLGFTKVYEGASYPALGPFAFDDRAMDESFSVYDHPQVLIFQKERQLDRDQLRALFAPAIERPLSPTRYPKTKTLTLGQLVDRLPAVSDYAWNRGLGANGLAATLLWLLVVEVLGLLALPLALWLFRGFPDRGWGLSKLLGWLLLAYPVWLGASLELTRFTLPCLLLALTIGAAFAAAAGYRWRRRWRATVRGAGPAILLSEGVFLVLGAFFLALRASNPDLWHTYWGGEKPMELAHLNAILRSANFPPYDPWFAGGTINYYYFGQYLVATIVKLTGLPVEIAFNLAMPTLSALVAGAGFSVSGGLAGLALRGRARGAGTPPPQAGAPGPTAPEALAFGALGAVLLVGIGNLDGLARLVARTREANPAPLTFDFFWGASRTVDGAITEFPFFTQIWADLHAHAVALPFTILALGLVVALATAPTIARPGVKGTTGQILSLLPPYLAPLALTLGALACTNSWDVPTFLLVTGAGLFYAGGLGRPESSGRGIARRLAVAIAGTGLTGLAAYLLYLPFFRGFRVIGAEGLARTRVPTPLRQYLDHFGLFIAIVVIALAAGLLVHGRRARGPREIVAPIGVALAAIGMIVGLKATALTAWLATHTRFFAGEDQLLTVIDGTTAALLLPLLILLVTLWVLAWGELRLQLPLALLIAAVGVTLGPEIVFVADDLQGGEVRPGAVIWERMNTVFKFYLQGWTLFALGGVGALAWLYDSAPRWSGVPFRRLRSRVDRRFGTIMLRGLVATPLVLLLLGSFVYPAVATPIRVAERFAGPPGLGPSLNGYRWMAYGTIPNERCEEIGFRDDYAAIEWLNTTIGGTPVIAEASIGPYRGNGSRFANATGLPTILGWHRHQYQQRPASGIATRSDDVRALYNSPNESEKLAVLQRYYVSYVIVGAVERHFYYSPPGGTPCGAATDAYASPAGLAALEGMAERYLTPVFRSGETVIYRVLPAAGSAGADVADVVAGEPAAAR